MPERHLHFNVLTLIWLYLAIVLIANAAKFVVRKWPVPGLATLIENA